MRESIFIKKVLRKTVDIGISTLLKLKGLGCALWRFSTIRRLGSLLGYVKKIQSKERKLSKRSSVSWGVTCLVLHRKTPALLFIEGRSRPSFLFMDKAIQVERLFPLWPSQFARPYQEKVCKLHTLFV